MGIKSQVFPSPQASIDVLRRRIRDEFEQLRNNQNLVRKAVRDMARRAALCVEIFRNQLYNVKILSFFIVLMLILLNLLEFGLISIRHLLLFGFKLPPFCFPMTQICFQSAGNYILFNILI